MKVPFAISVIEPADIQHMSGRGLNEPLANIPGVLTQSRFGNHDIRLTIRGFGARGAGERSNAGTSRGVRVLSDGIPETEPDGRTAFDLIDLSGAGRIEVVRSNSSTLWGNAAGGIINITSNTSFDQPYLNLRSTLGSYGYKKQYLQLGTIAGTGKIYFSFSDVTYDGWREHSRSAQTLLRAGMLSMLDESTELGVHIAATSTYFKIPGPLTQAQFDANPQQAQNDPANYNPTYVQRDERRLNRLGRIGVTLSHKFGQSNTISTMTYVNPKFLERSERNTFRDFTRYHFGGNFIYRYDDSEENSRRSFLAGVDEAYQDGAILFYSLQNGERGTTLRDNKREGANNFGAFFQGELSVTDQLIALVGGRYDAISYYAESYINSKLDASRTFSRFTPKGGLTFQFTPTQSIYASVGGGVEVPAGNETDPPATFGLDTVTALNPVLEPITSTTIEVGTKHFVSLDESGFLKAVSYDVALYWLEVRNDIIPYRGGRFYFTAGRTQRVGAEIAIRAQMSEGLSLQTSLTISKNTYKEYVVDSVHYGKPGVFGNYAEKEMAGVPETFYNVTLKYSPSFASYMFTELSVHGVGTYFADDANQYPVQSYNVLDAVIGLDKVPLSGDHVSLSGYIGINNLTDKRYASSVFINPDINGAGVPIYLEPGLPRNVIGSLGVNWMF